MTRAQSPATTLIPPHPYPKSSMYFEVTKSGCAWSGDGLHRNTDDELRIAGFVEWASDAAGWE